MLQRESNKILMKEQYICWSAATERVIARPSDNSASLLASSSGRNNNTRLVTYLTNLHDATNFRTCPTDIETRIIFHTIRKCCDIAAVY